MFSLSRCLINTFEMRPEDLALQRCLVSLQLCSADGALHDGVDLSSLVASIAVNGKMYALHPEFVDETDSGYVTTFCRRCANAARKVESAWCSLAKGHQYGRLCHAEAASWLPQLTVGEKALLADVRVYQDVVKLSASGGSDPSTAHCVLRGHCICFLHSGPSVAWSQMSLLERAGRLS